MGRTSVIRIAGLCGAAFALCACDREQREFNPPPASAAPPGGIRQTDLQPGQPVEDPPVKSKYDENAYAISEGKTLFSQFNCVGCHAHGGGAIGPPLMDDEWIYGSKPEQVFSTILEGRPNGMPSFKGKLTDDQAWKLVAYVRSLGGLTSKTAAPGRDDHMRTSPPENTMPSQKPRTGVGASGDR